ncbi:MAG: hypothetical protein R2746_07160 [Acidimicrobiales bacterium]
MLAADDGFWLVRDVMSNRGFGTTSALFSPDGRDWAGAPTELAGAPTTAGVLRGRPAVALNTGSGRTWWSLEAGGPQTTHLDTVVDGEPNAFVSSNVGFGPLGVAFTFTSGMGDDGRGGRTVVVLGRRHDLLYSRSYRPRRRERSSGRTASPCRPAPVIVRLNSYPKGAVTGDGGVRPTRRAFVGTPD